MALGPHAIAFGAAAVMVCGLSAWATHNGPRYARNSFAVGLMLMLTFAVSNACHLMPSEFRYQPFKYVDCIGAVLTILLWYSDGDEVSWAGRAWELALAFTFLSETIIHAVLNPHTLLKPQCYEYDLLLNIVFAVQLVLASIPGGRRLGTIAGVRLRARRVIGRIRGSVA